MSNVYTVSQINSYIRHLFEEDFALRAISIKGEVSNCKYHSSGHIYFTLKDKDAGISAVMFAGNRKGLKFKLRDGQQVVAVGTVNVYERDGKYQLYVKEITDEGEGDLFRRFEELKSELLEMGMFDAEYKKKIPEYALKVGIVTSPTGAAIRDIMNISSRRNPCVQLYLYPALVQGEGAVSSIVSGIHRLDAMKLDVLIVGRGGGSIEDLWAFNEEAVARAIFGCNTPVISAVGHETDVTISDYVADMRAPTPSAAAELAVFDYEKFLEKLRNIKYTLQKNVRNHWIYKRSLLENLTLKLEKMNPQKVLFDKRQQLDTDTDRLKMLIERKLMFEKHRLALAAERLNGMSPLKKLESGFAYVSSGGKNIKSIEQAAQGETLDITVCDGQIRAEVLEISDGRENDN
ncbi:MAG: exodeoxyribonuclease VII large subunit [Lachnospiraceae bacterium]|nr:exodeoxyribonuclease VII large subunit [Lachnospiraceae bacterium]MCI9369873.1 exodeoxyribonuclease VII large subunit [Lachnospiraceae bacterium]